MINDFQLFRTLATLRVHCHNFWHIAFSTYKCFFFQSKTFSYFFKKIIDENFGKNFILTGYVFIFLKIILQSSLHWINHYIVMVTYSLKNYFLHFLTFLVICNKAILRGHIFNIGNGQFSKLIFCVVLNYKLSVSIL